MSSLDLFQSLLGSDSRLKVFTTSNSRSIPATEGCYAWFLPLWIFNKDFDKLVSSVAKLLHYEPEQCQSNVFDYRKDSIEVQVTKMMNTRVFEDHAKTWNTLIEEEDSKEYLENLLLEASLFMPPLYIGQTKNLNARYNQHVKQSPNKNNFNSRFSGYIKETFFNLTVSDLLFVCIQTKNDFADNQEQDKKVSQLIEHILIRLCRPSFSERG